MVVRKCKILVIRMLRLGNRQVPSIESFVLYMYVYIYIYIYIYVYILNIYPSYTYILYIYYGYVFILFVCSDMVLSDPFMASVSITEKAPLVFGGF